MFDPTRLHTVPCGWLKSRVVESATQLPWIKSSRSQPEPSIVSFLETSRSEPSGKSSAPVLIRIRQRLLPHLARLNLYAAGVAVSVGAKDGVTLAVKVGVMVVVIVGVTGGKLADGLAVAVEEGINGGSVVKISVC